MWDQFINNRMRDVETNQSLAYMMATQKNPAWKYDFASGQFLEIRKILEILEGSDKTDIYNTIMKTILSRLNELDRYIINSVQPNYFLHK